ncbi:MAG: SLC13 family permease, partial [Halobaculum sp.]
LLAGVIPLGIALQTSGAAVLLAELVADAATVLPPLAILAVFYAVTAALTNVVSNNASVVLMIPVAIQTAVALDTDPLAFAMAVTFAASTAFVTPVGYQTNLFVYGPGGYKFSDYVRVGGPLQLLFALVTPLGVQFFFG